uniref:NADH-ubiquinone oxidoreductase chain 6 n=1 Tax=Eucampia zodiacus TaxID=444606 RepID=A0A7T0GG28_9STRA|nr:NADH dehydrogenase subunit 6 [Eucampia zodiacus]QPJ79909.1 NADH dehydrogenase subunit 6 [Eucampia zodiacus]
MIINFLFYFFSFSLILSSLMVISVQNAVHSVLFLVLSFISSASLLFLLECEFIALLFIMIYVGAIAVLFLFVVMMLDTKIVNIKKDLVKYFPFGSLIGILFSFEIFLLISKNFTSNSYINSVLYNFHTNWFDKLDTLTELESIGQILYTNYVLQFLIAGNILLLSAIGAVSLTLKTKQSSRKQIIFKQLSRTYKNVLIV